MKGSVARSEAIIGLFNDERLDPAATDLVAVAIISDTTVADVVDVTTGEEVDMAQYLADKTVRQFQPQYIPAGAHFTPSTKFVERRFAYGESHDDYDVNRHLAAMLSDMLDDDELAGCTALSLRGLSHALGETRLAVVAKTTAGVSPRETYTKPIMGSIVGTYETYNAPDIETAQRFLDSKTVTAPFYYVEIYTPKGGIGKDCEGSYEFDAD